ncbi:MAG: DNA mismatch endonuclease Vsr [Pseudomonadota bacterium]|nr:DNA mismatch endonuclease Vsr [Pseudomonadota bacterium]
MADRLSAAQRSENMRRIKSADTNPELLVRRLVHGMGYRYRLHRKDMPGKPDLVFGPRRKVIFVHGCFWHQHSGCRAGRMPGSNQAYWKPKLQRNKDRDEAARQALELAGWQVMIIWDCETRDQRALEARLTAFLTI